MRRMQQAFWNVIGEIRPVVAVVEVGAVAKHVLPVVLLGQISCIGQNDPAVHYRAKRGQVGRKMRRFDGRAPVMFWKNCRAGFCVANPIPCMVSIENNVRHANLSAAL